MALRIEPTIEQDLLSAGEGGCLFLCSDQPADVVMPVVEAAGRWADGRDGAPGNMGSAYLPGRPFLRLDCSYASLDGVAELCRQVAHLAARAGVEHGSIESDSIPDEWEVFPARQATVEAFATDVASLPRRRDAPEPPEVRQWLAAGIAFLDPRDGEVGSCINDYVATVTAEQFPEVVTRNARPGTLAAYWCERETLLRVFRVAAGPRSLRYEVGVGLGSGRPDLLDEAVGSLIEIIGQLRPAPGYGAVAIGQNWPLTRGRLRRLLDSGALGRPNPGTVPGAFHWQRLTGETLARFRGAATPVGEQVEVRCGAPQLWLENPDAARDEAERTLSTVLYQDPPPRGPGARGPAGGPR